MLSEWVAIGAQKKSSAVSYNLESAERAVNINTYKTHLIRVSSHATNIDNFKDTVKVRREWRATINKCCRHLERDTKN